MSWFLKAKKRKCLFRLHSWWLNINSTSWRPWIKRETLKALSMKRTFINSSNKFNLKDSMLTLWSVKLFFSLSILITSTSTTSFKSSICLLKSKFLLYNNLILSCILVRARRSTTWLKLLSRNKTKNTNSQKVFLKADKNRWVEMRESNVLK